DRPDISGVQLWHLDQSFPLHRRYLTKAFRDALIDVVGLGLGGKDSGINSKKRNTPGEWIRECLEDERGKGVAVRELSLSFGAVTVLAFDRAAGNGVRQIRNDIVQE